VFWALQLLQQLQHDAIVQAASKQQVMVQSTHS
jgi:hypothetical protein